MGGRGARSATYMAKTRAGNQGLMAVLKDSSMKRVVRESNAPDGYTIQLQRRNLIFVSKENRQSKTLMQSKKTGQVYVHVEGKDLRSVIYFDSEKKRYKQIDFDHRHRGLQPHVHRGYFHQEFDKEQKRLAPTVREQRMIDRVTKIWQNHING